MSELPPPSRERVETELLRHSRKTVRSQTAILRVGYGNLTQTNVLASPAPEYYHCDDAQADDHEGHDLARTQQGGDHLGSGIASHNL